MTRIPSPMSWRKRDNIAGRPWRGRVRDYDLFKELTIGLVVVGLLLVTGVWDQLMNEARQLVSSFRPVI